MSRLTRWTMSLVVASLLVAAPVLGQETAKPDAGELLKAVPAGCMGFAVVKDVKGFTTKIDNFIKQIGLSQMLPATGVLDLLKGGLELGDTVTLEGSVGMVMLDPQQYGLDLVGLMSGKTDPDKAGQPPLVFILKGDDPMKMFAPWNPVKEGDLTKFQRPGRPAGYAVKKGNYILAGPNSKAVQAAAAAAKSMAETLSVADKAMLARNDLTVWADMKVLGPILDAAIVVMKMQGGAETRGPVGFNMDPQMVMQKAFRDGLADAQQTLKQLGDVALGARVEQPGVLLEVQVSYLPDSALGKTLAAVKPVKESLLNRLPTMPYILAMGVKDAVQTPREEAEKQLESAFAREPFKDLSPENKAKLKEVILGLDEQVTGMQIYIGGLTKGAGQFGIVAVCECQSTDKVRELLARGVEVAAEALKTVKDEPFKDLTVKYQKDLEAVGDAKADAISLDHPEMAKMPEDERAKFKSVMGEDKLRLLVLPADKNTLVCTFGGGTSLLTEAVKIAKERSGKLDQDPGIVKAMGLLPKSNIAVGFFNIGNVFTVVKNISAAVGQQPPPFNLTAQTPFAFSVSVEKTDMTLAGFLPADTIGEVVKMFMGIMGGGPGLPANDF